METNTDVHCHNVMHCKHNMHACICVYCYWGMYVCANFVSYMYVYCFSLLFTSPATWSSGMMQTPWKFEVHLLVLHAELNLEKRGNLAHFQICSKMLIMSGTIAAMNFKPRMNILSSSYYTHCNSRTPPTSGMGEVSACVHHIRKMLFYAPLWRLTT